VLAGGVAANAYLRHVLMEFIRPRLPPNAGSVQIVAPPAALCTDNAAMIAWTGLQMYRKKVAEQEGRHHKIGDDELAIRPVRKWSLEDL